MKIDCAKLKSALEIVKPGLANREFIDQSTSFAFLDGKVVTYNDEISISHPLEGLDINGAVAADSLYKFISKVKKDELEMDVNSNEILFSSGRMKASLALQTQIKLPLRETIVENPWHDLPSDFNASLNFAVAVCGKASGLILSSVHITEDGLIESSDSFRIIRCSLLHPLPVKSFLLPSNLVATVVKLNPVSISEGRGWIHFKTEKDTIISCRTFKDEYPDIDKHLRVKGINLTFPENIEDVLERASVFAKRDNIMTESITILLMDGLLKVYSRAEGFNGWFEEEMDFDYKGKDIKFFITPSLLKDILKTTNSCVLSESKLKFEGEGWEFVTVLRG